MNRSEDEERPRSARRAQSSIENHLDRCIERLTKAVEKRDSRVERIAPYFLRVDESCVATQSVAKGRLAERLRQSLLKPQIVTVQGRGSRKAVPISLCPWS